MFSCALGLFYTLPSIILGLFPFEGLFFSINRSLLAYQNFIIFLFVIVTFLTFNFLKSSKKSYLNFNFNNTKVIFISVILILIGNLTKLHLLNKGLYSLEDTFNEDYKEIPRYLLFIRNLDLWGFFYLSILTSKHLFCKKYFKIKLFYFLEIIFLVGFSIFQGRRTGAILPIVIFILSYSFYFKIKIRKIIIPVIILLGLVISTTYYRLALIASSLDSTIIKNMIFEAIFTRVSNSYIILNNVIDYGYKTGFDSFLLSLIGLIPSVFLEDKPNLSIGNEFGKELGLININNVTTGINPGWIGESYYNYGLIGVVFGGVVFSFLIGYFFKKSSFSYDSSKLLLIMLFIFIFSGFQMEIAASLNNFLKGFLFLIFISGFIPRLTFFK
ncbi:MAG: O-antigen ligase [Polaribacter sp.]|nr:O-antigen ligase [Polaribacter sp.]